MATSQFMLMEESTVPKWKIALAVGGAIAVGAGIYYKFYRCQSPVKAPPRKSKSKEMKLNNVKPDNIVKDDVSNS